MRLSLLLISLASIFKLCLSSWQVYIRKGVFSFYTKFVATEADRKNPDYNDPCFSELSIICSYCCILSKGECSNDIRACDPMMVDERNFHFFYIMVGTLIGVICGCPLAAKILEYLINSRCMIVSNSSNQFLICLVSLRVHPGCDLF